MARTKVDETQLSGLDYKQSCRAASTVNNNLLGSMTVTIDANSTAPTTGSAVTTIDHTTLTVGVGSNRALIVQLSFLGNVTPTSVVWDQGGTNQACTLIASEASALGSVSSLMYGLVAPTSGNKTLRVSWSGSHDVIVNAIAFVNVLQTGGSTTFPPATGTTSNSTSPSITITSALDHMTLDNVATAASLGSAKTQSGPTHDGGSTIFGFGSYAIGAASNTHHWTITSGKWAQVGTDIVSAVGTILDGVTLATGDRFLLKNQTTPSQNGIYVANVGAPTRPTDAVDGQLSSGAFCFITAGTLNADSMWLLTTLDPITVGSTSLTWTQFGALTTSLAMQAQSSGVQDGVNKTYVWPVFAASTETLFINGVATDRADYSVTPTTGTIVLGATIGAPAVADQLRLSFLQGNSGPVQAAATPTVIVNISNFAGDGVTVNFTLNIAPIYTGFIAISVNGIMQPLSAWGAAGSVVTMGVAPVTGDMLMVIYYATLPVTGTPKQEDFVGDGSSTDFTVSHTVNTVLMVAMGGIMQATTAWSLISTNIIRFVTAPITGAGVSVSYLY